MDTTAMVFARLIGTPGLASWAGAPAVFSDRVPDAWVFDSGSAPCAVIVAATQDVADDTFGETRRVVRQEVRLYAADTGSTAGLDTAARAVRDRFDGQEPVLAIAGGVVTVATVDGPADQPTTNAAVLGRRLTLTFTLEEQA